MWLAPAYSLGKSHARKRRPVMSLATRFVRPSLRRIRATLARSRCLSLVSLTYLQLRRLRCMPRGQPGSRSVTRPAGASASQVGTAFLFLFAGFPLGGSVRVYQLE